MFGHDDGRFWQAAGTGQHRKAKDNPLPTTTVKALIARQWILEPDLDLFGDRHSGRLTVREEHAPNRFYFG